eukprot:5712066-Prymnesium_polylepis.1
MQRDTVPLAWAAATVKPPRTAATWGFGARLVLPRIITLTSWTPRPLDRCPLPAADRMPRLWRHHESSSCDSLRVDRLLSYFGRLWRCAEKAWKQVESQPYHPQESHSNIHALDRGRDAVQDEGAGGCGPMRRCSTQRLQLDPTTWP